jgi:prephenate dehydrogenase
MSVEPPFRSALIAGLGLIGGSLARDLVARGVKVIGYDRDAETMKSAEGEGIIADRGNPDATDVIILAMPVTQTLWLIENMASKFSAAELVTDVCSTKASVVQAAEKAGLPNFVGTHPMAGDHRSGWSASRCGLFTGARSYICPTRLSHASAITLAEKLWECVGAQPERIDAAAHDREVAWTSHLPHAVSAALATTLATAQITRDRLGPGGRDVTRLAGANPELWTGIALDNSEELATAIDELQSRLSELRKALGDRDRATVQRQFGNARDWFDDRAPKAQRTR